MSIPAHVYKIRPRQGHRGVDLISDALPFGRLWYDTPDNAIGYAMHRSRSHAAVIRVYDEAGNVIETHNHAGDFKSDGNATALLIVQNRLQCGLAYFKLGAHFLDLRRLFLELRDERLDFLSLLSNSGLEIFALLCDARFLFSNRGF